MIASRLSDSRLPFQVRPLPVLFATALIGIAAQAAELAVANSSFESPVVPPNFPALPELGSWERPADQGSFSGVFPNPPVGSPDRIVTGLDGNQAAFLIGEQGVVISQKLESQFEAGLQYTLTVALAPGGAIHAGDSLTLELFYLNDAGQSVSVATTSVRYDDPLPPPTITALIDKHAISGVLQAGDAPVGKDIHVQIAAGSTVPHTGPAYWDLDNVRVSASTVPEPGTWALMILGLGGLVISRRRMTSRK